LSLDPLQADFSWISGERVQEICSVKEIHSSIRSPQIQQPIFWILWRDWVSFYVSHINLFHCLGTTCLDVNWLWRLFPRTPIAYLRMSVAKSSRMHSANVNLKYYFH
jgi:hypothetical protein